MTTREQHGRGPTVAPDDAREPGGPARPGRASSSIRPDTPDAEATGTRLARRYREYRRRQGTALLSLIPRQGIRPLYRAALERAASRDAPVREEDDMIGFLADFCSELLPLPPFEVWHADFTAHRAEHLDEAETLASAAPSDPVTVEIRSFADPDGEMWYASLDVRRTGVGWRGSISFHAEAGGRTARTADVFREADATTIRSRFLEFGTATLQAFLRSVLP